MVRIFKQYIPVSFLMLALVEYSVYFFSGYLGIALIYTIDPSYGEVQFPNFIVYKALVFAGILLLSMAAMGLYQRRFRHGWSGMVLRIITAFVLAGIAISLTYYLFPMIMLYRSEALAVIGVSFSLTILIRYVFFKTLDQKILKKRILVLGAGEQACQITDNLRRKTDQRGFAIVGFVHIRGEHDMVDESMVVRPDVPLLTLATQLQIEEIVVAVGDRRRKAFPVQELLDCKLSGIDVIDLLGFFEREIGKIKLDVLNPSELIFSDGFNRSEARDLRKRIFDITISLLILTIVWPAMLLVALAILIEDKGKAPIFYKQVRVGQHWKLFHVVKFRSMRPDAEKGGKPQWAQKNDSRVTRIGSFIRKVRLDELPQLFNVLKGEMSFVGPRPERPEFVTDLSEKIPYFSERHRVTPGITGWAQVCYPYGASEKDSLEKLQYDLYYIKNYNLFLDLVIILQTAHEVIWGKGGR